jgi:hypothetical protein
MEFATCSPPHDGFYVFINYLALLPVVRAHYKDRRNLRVFGWKEHVDEEALIRVIDIKASIETEFLSILMVLMRDLFNVIESLFKILAYLYLSLVGGLSLLRVHLGSARRPRVYHTAYSLRFI